MPFITRYFDSLVEPLFKTDTEGREIYFPAGVFSKGRVVTDAAEGVALRRKVRGAYIVLFLGVLPLSLGLLPWLRVSTWVAAIVMGAVVGLAMNAYFYALARHLPASDERMNMGEAYRSQAQKLGRGWLLALAISMAVLAMASVAAALLDDTFGLVEGIAAAAFFSALTAVFVYQLRSLKSV